MLPTRVKSDITITDLTGRLQHVVGREIEVIRSQLIRIHVELIAGTASFVDPHTLTVRGEGAGGDRMLTAEKIVIGTGTTPARPPHITFDGQRVLDSDEILILDKVPESLVVVGPGVIGVEYASIFAALGTPGHLGGEAAPDAGLGRPRDRGVAEVPPARPRYVVPLR